MSENGKNFAEIKNLYYYYELPVDFAMNTNIENVKTFFHLNINQLISW